MINLQMFADGEGEEGEVEGREEMETQSTETGETNTPDAGESGDEEYIPKSQASSAVQSRLEQEKKKYEPYKNLVSKLEKATGMTSDQIEQYIEQQQKTGGAGNMEQQNQQQQMNPQMNNLQQTTQAAAQVALETRRMLEEEKLKQDSLFSDYDDVKDEVRDFADKTGVDLRQAYLAVKGEDKINEVKEKTEKQVVANLESKGGLGAEEDGVKEEMEKYDLSEEEMELAKMAGMSAEEFASMRDAHNLDDYLAIQEEGE